MAAYKDADMNAQTVNGELAVKVLDEYVKEFQSCYPNLRIFSAHLHVDEATPHLYIDFIPFTTGSKRGREPYCCRACNLLWRGIC